MVTNLYKCCGGHLSLDLVNVIDRDLDEEPTERLLEYADLLRWSEDAGTLDARETRRLARRARQAPSAGAAVLARAIALREAIFRTFQGPAKGARAPARDLELLNQELASAMPHARIVTTTPVERAYKWSWEPPGDCLDAPLWPIVRAAADLLTSPDRGLVRECAAPRCEWLFLDRTKNHGRRWCDMRTCGNREKGRKHRRRRGSNE